MSVKTLTAIEKQIHSWLSELENLTDQELSAKRDDKTWSLSQLHSHLFRGTQNFHLMHVRKCLDSQSDVKRNKTFKGRISFLLGQFPPIRIKVPPTKEYTPIELSKSELIEQAHHLLSAIDDLKPLFSQSVISGKTAHPAFGYLNAAEWLGIIAMHFQHHVRQRNELLQWAKENSHQLQLNQLSI